MTVNFGMIGYGLWGSYHARAIERAEQAELKAIAVASEATAAKARGQHAAEVYTDYRNLLARDDIDAVSVAVPNHLHHEVAMAALRAGKHLLLEKPMALTVEHCQDIIDEAAGRGLQVQIGLESRYSPLWGKIKQYVDEGKIGVLKSASIHLSRFPYRDGSAGWRKDFSRVGNWILEEPIHFYDRVRWYFEGSEEPVSLYALGNSRESRWEDHDLFENITTVISFSKGGYATVNQTLAAYGHHLTGELIGAEGVIKAWWSGVSERIPEPFFKMEYFDGKETKEVKIDSVPGEIFEVEHQLKRFIEVVNSGAKPDVTGEDGLWAVKLSLAAQESIVGNTVVQL
jgi:myo-inositol 2-dehydrogenase/D-chiro-inositol 1-dehydrogenase